MILLITNYNNNQLYKCIYSFILTYKILANITFENDNYRMGLLKKYIGKYKKFIHILTVYYNLYPVKYLFI